VGRANRIKAKAAFTSPQETAAHAMNWTTRWTIIIVVAAYGGYDRVWGEAMKTYTTADFARWGARGSKARKHRKLTPEQARAMVRARERKRKEKQTL